MSAGPSPYAPPPPTLRSRSTADPATRRTTPGASGSGGVRSSTEASSTLAPSLSAELRAVGEEVELGAAVEHIPDGTPATIRILSFDGTGAEEELDPISSTVSGGRVATPWQVHGPVGRSLGELDLEFEVRSARAASGRRRIDPPRTRKVEVVVDAPLPGRPVLRLPDAPFYTPRPLQPGARTGAWGRTAAFEPGTIFTAEMPSGYRGLLVVQQGGRSLLELDLSPPELCSEEPIRIRLAMRGPATTSAAARLSTGAIKLPSAAALPADGAGWVQRQGVPPSRGTDDLAYIHEVSRHATIREGVHHTGALETSGALAHLYGWFIAETLGTNLPALLTDAYESRKLLRDFGAKFYVKKTNGRQYIIFRGAAALRRHLTGTRYRIANPTVVRLTAGGAAGAAGAVRDAALGRATGIALIIVGALDILEWAAKAKQGEATLADLLVQLGMDAAKVVLSTVITMALLSVTAPAAAAIGASAGMIIVGSFIVGWGIGTFLDFVDEKTGTSAWLVERASNRGNGPLRDTFVDHVSRPVRETMEDLQDAIREADARLSTAHQRIPAL